MFRDERRYEVWSEIRQHGLRAFSRQLTPQVFEEVGRRCGAKPTKNPLCWVNLIWLGVASALHAGLNFSFVLSTTLKLLEDQQQFVDTKLGKAKRNGQRAKKNKETKRRGRRSKHDPRRHDPTKISEEAFVKARRRMPLRFWTDLIIVLTQQFEVEHGDLLKFRSFRLLAMDGTRLDLPNYAPLKRHFGVAKNNSGQHNAQARMLMLQFPLARLPYRYDLAPVSVGETTMALRLAESLCPRDLVLLDAGFLSFGLFCGIHSKGAFFAIRLTKKICVKTRRKLGSNDRVVSWTPKDSRGQWRKLGLPKSMELRIVRYRVRGFRPQQLLTNVLDPLQISVEDWTRLTTESDAGRNLFPGLYHRRWEIETTYEELKVSQQLDRCLRSRTPESIRFEVAGHLVYYLLVRWLMVQAAVRHGLNPLRLSFLDALRELEQMRPSLICADPVRVALVLLPRLLDRIAEHQVPYRPGRQYPRKKKKTPNTPASSKARQRVKKKG